MGQKALERNAQAYDMQMLTRIGGPRAPPPRPAEPAPPATATEPRKMTLPIKPGRPGLQERRHTDTETTTLKWINITQGSIGAGGPKASAASPRISGLRSPMSDAGTSTFPRTSVSGIKPAENLTLSPPNPSSLRISPDIVGGVEKEDFPMGNTDAQDGAVHDQSPTGSERTSNTRKRRAESPPGESVIDPRLPGSSANDSLARKSTPKVDSRVSQLARFQGTPGSLSSTASSLPQSASFASSLGTSVASTSTSYSADQGSPNLYASAEVVPASEQPQPTTITSGGIQQIAYMVPPAQHRRATSNVQRAPGLWICDCCPKKPKKFDSEEELR